MKKILFVLIAVLFTACASMGTKIDPQQLESIVVGQTTKNEMIEKFGSPLSLTLNSDGKLIGLWSYTKAMAFGPVKMQQLSVLFDDDEKVEKFSLNDGKIKTGLLF